MTGRSTFRAITTSIPLYSVVLAAISWPLSLTSLRVATISNDLASAKAVYSPTLCPINTSSLFSCCPLSLKCSHCDITMRGCATHVLLSCPLLSALVISRKSKSSYWEYASISLRNGSLSLSSMPLSWVPCPANRNIRLDENQPAIHNLEERCMIIP